MIRWNNTLFLLAVTAFVLTGCRGGYSFTGSDAGMAKTVSVLVFPNQADLVNPQLSQSFTEQLRTTLVQQSSLALVPRDGDLHFSGAIVNYSVTPQAPSANELVALSRLTITVKVTLVNATDSKRSFEQLFLSTRDYSSAQDLRAVEDALVQEMVKELAEKIFTRALVNW